MSFSRLLVLALYCFFAVSPLAAQTTGVISPIARYFNNNWDDASAATLAPFSLATNLNNFPSGEGLIKEYTALDLNQSVLNSILALKPRMLKLQMPIAGGGMHEYQLIRTEVLDPSFSSSTSAGPFTYQPGVYYRGVLAGNTQSVAAISFFADEVIGVTSFGGENYVIGSLTSKGAAPTNNYAYYKESDLLAQNPFHCSTQAASSMATAGMPNNAPSASQLTATSSCRNIRVFFVCDNQLYLDRGSNATSVNNYVTALFNVVGALYYNESIFTNISQIFVYSVADPYVGMTSTSTILSAFGQNTGNGFNGDLAHLLSSRNLGGGIAWLDVLCFGNNNGSPQFAGPYAFSADLEFATTPFPAYAWDATVTTHEMGHNLGSRHTHNCGWNGNNTAIDGCTTVEGSCATPANPAKGTIMSYCHLVSGVGIDFTLGFGPQPGAKIRNGYNTTNASCLSTATLNATISVTGGTNICSSAGPTLTANPSTGFNYYQWYNNGNVIQGATSSTFTPTGAGTFSVQVSLGNCPALSNATTITGAPSSDFSVSNTNPGTSQNVTITYTGTGLVTDTYAWNFNGATIVSGSGRGPYVVNWGSGGTKNVTLTVTSGACNSGQTSKSVVVCTKPSSTFTYGIGGSTTGNPGTVSTTDVIKTFISGVTGNSYFWNAGGPITNSGTQFTNSISFRYNNTGTYLLTLFVVNNACTSAVTSFTINVTSGTAPCTTPNATLTESAPVCTGTATTVAFASSAGTSPFNGVVEVNGNTINFTGMGTTGSINIPASNLVVGTNKVFFLALQSSTACTSIPTDTAFVVVNSAPTATFTVNPSSPTQSVASTITFTGAAGIGTTYSWNFGSGASPATANTVGPHSVTYSTTGSKTISLTVTNPGCTAVNSSSNITVTAGSCTGTSSMSINPSSPIQNSAATFTFTGSVAGGTTYSWNFGSGASPATATTVGPHSVTYSTTGAKTATVTITEPSCTPVVATNNFTVTTCTPPNATIAAGSAVCQGFASSVTFTSSAGTSPFSGTLSVNGNSVNFTNITSGTAISIPAGNLNVGANTVSFTNLVDASTCSAVPTSTASITVNANPNGTLAAGAAVCLGTASSVTFTSSAGTSPYSGSLSVNGNTVNFTNITSGTAISIPAGNLNVGPNTVSFTSLSSASGCTAGPTSTASVTVNANPNGTLAPGATVCQGTASSVTFTSTAGTSPFSGSLSVNGNTVNFTNLSSGGTITIPAGNLVAGSNVVSFTSLVSANGCSNVPTSTATITVSPTTVAGTTGTAASVCPGSNSGTITLTGQTGSVVRWESSINGGTTWSPITNTTSTLTYTNIPLTTRYRAVVQSGACALLASSQTVITTFPAANGTLAAGAAVCSGLPSQVTVTATSGNGPFSGTLSVNGNSIPFTNQTSPFTVTVPVNSLNVGSNVVSFTNLTTTNGCSAVPTSTATLTVFPPANATITSSSAVCSGQASTVTFNTISGNPPFSGILSVNGNTVSFTGVTNGSTITIPAITLSVGSNVVSFGSLTSTNSCSAVPTSTAVLTVNPLPIGTITAGPNVCQGGLLKVRFASTVGTGPFTVVLSLPAGTQSYPNVVNGDSLILNSALLNVAGVSSNLSILSITDANGCVNTSVSSTATVLNYPTPLANLVAGPDVCLGATGKVYFNSVAGNPPFSGSLSVGSNTVSFSGLNAVDSITIPAGAMVLGDNIVTFSSLVSGNGCTGTQTARDTIVLKPLPSIQLSSGPNLCLGSNGSVNASVTSGVLPFTGTLSVNGNSVPYTITSTPAVLSIPANVLVAGTNTVTVASLSSANGCSNVPVASAAVNVVLPAAITISAGPNVCVGTATSVNYAISSGSAPFNGTLQVSGNAIPFTVTANSGSITIPGNFLVAGTNVVSFSSFTGGNGCISVPASTASFTAFALPDAALTSPSICTGSPAKVYFTRISGSVPFSGTVKVNGSTTFPFANFAASDSITIPAVSLILGTNVISFGPVTTADGCVATPVNTATFSVLPSATASFNVATSGNSYVYTFNGTAPAGSTYAWDFGTNASPATASTVGPHTVSYTTAGTKDVTLIVKPTGCTPDTIVTSVNVTTGQVTCNIPTGINVTALSDTSVTIVWSASAQATGYEVFYRKVGSGLLLVATSMASPITISGLTRNTNYEYFVRSACPNSQFSQNSTTKFFTTTNVTSAELQLTEAISAVVYPNPSKEGKFTLRVSNVEGRELTMTLNDAIGRQILQEAAFSSVSDFVREFDLNLGNGTYLLRIQIGEQQLLARVVVLR
jgi:hypothetical protein